MTDWEEQTEGMQTEDGDEDTYVEGRRWDGKSWITKGKKGRKKGEGGRGLHYGYHTVLIS